MAIPVSDSSPESGPSSRPADDVDVVPATAGTRELVAPDDVLADWFSAGPDDNVLFGLLTEAYETEIGAGAALEVSTDDLAAIAVGVVQRYLRDHATAPGPADAAGWVDPAAALTDWFSQDAGEPLSEPAGMLETAFETDAHEDSGPSELAGVALSTVQRYLRDCAAETDG